MKLTKSMPNDEKWDVSSSTRYMYVNFRTGSSFGQGFAAKINYGNEINDIEITFAFQFICNKPVIYLTMSD